MLESFASEVSAEAALSAMGKWAALCHRRFCLPSTASSTVADGTRTRSGSRDVSITTRAETGEKGGLSSLFDSDALPVLFRRFLLPAPRQEQHHELQKPPSTREDELETAKIGLERLMHWALPNLVSVLRAIGWLMISGLTRATVFP